MFNGYSASGDVTAPLVYVNYGLPPDYEALKKLGVDVTGKIAIARYGNSFRGVKAKVAAGSRRRSGYSSIPIRPTMVTCRATSSFRRGPSAAGEFCTAGLSTVLVDGAGRSVNTGSARGARRTTFENGRSYNAAAHSSPADFLRRRAKTVGTATRRGAAEGFPGRAAVSIST